MITKYFKKVLKYRKVYVEQYNDQFLISDADVLLKVSPTLKLFKDQKLFPELPTDGKCYTYKKDFFHQDGPVLKNLINVNDNDVKEIYPKPWQYYNYVLFRQGQKFLFVNKDFLELIKPPYTAYSEGSSRSPIFFVEKDCAISEESCFAIIMPIRVTVETKFPNIGELIE
jgi:hypothetical protein